MAKKCPFNQEIGWCDVECALLVREDICAFTSIALNLLIIKRILDRMEANY